MRMDEYVDLVKKLNIEQGNRENLFPPSADAEQILSLVFYHFLGNNYYHVDPLSGAQSRVYMLGEILHKYPEGSIRRIPKSKKENNK